MRCAYETRVYAVSWSPFTAHMPKIYCYRSIIYYFESVRFNRRCFQLRIELQTRASLMLST